MLEAPERCLLDSAGAEYQWSIWRDQAGRLVGLVAARCLGGIQEETESVELLEGHEILRRT